MKKLIVVLVIAVMVFASCTRREGQQAAAIYSGDAELEHIVENILPGVLQEYENVKMVTSMGIVGVDTSEANKWFKDEFLKNHLYPLYDMLDDIDRDTISPEYIRDLDNLLNELYNLEESL